MPKQAKVFDETFLEKVSMDEYIESLGVELECTLPANARNLEDFEVTAIRKRLKSGENLFSILKDIDASVNEEPLSNLYDSYQPGSDGSIVCNHEDFKTKEYRMWDATANGLSNLFDFLDYYYNYKGIITNSSCGFHIHIKFKDRQYYSMMTFARYYHGFMDAYKKSFCNTPKYNSRLNNHYCRPRHSVDNVLSAGELGESLKAFHNGGGLVKSKGGNSRYNAINYDALARHGTLEFRIMPYQESFVEAKQTLLWFINTVNDLCRSYDKGVDLAQNEEVELGIGLDRIRGLKDEHSLFAVRKSLSNCGIPVACPCSRKRASKKEPVFLFKTVSGNEYTKPLTSNEVDSLDYDNYNGYRSYLVSLGLIEASGTASNPFMLDKKNELSKVEEAPVNDEVVYH